MEASLQHRTVFACWFEHAPDAIFIQTQRAVSLIRIKEFLNLFKASDKQICSGRICSLNVCLKLTKLIVAARIKTMETKTEARSRLAKQFMLH